MSTTETPKTKTDSKPNGTTANPFAAFTPFDPMAVWNASQQMFRDAIAQAHTQASAMADKYSALDPMGYWASFREAMSTAQARNAEMAGKLDAQYVELEQQLVSRAHLAVATWAQLANDSIAYAAKLSADARKLGHEAAKKMGATA
jgi:hypothetical protein